MQFELSHSYGTAETASQTRAFGEAGTHLRLVHAKSAPRSLGPIHGDVGSFLKVVGRNAVVGIHCNANTEPYYGRSLRLCEGLGERFEQPLGDTHRSRPICRLS